MFSRVFSMPARVVARSGETQHRLESSYWREVPRLADSRAALDGLELVTPDRTGSQDAADRSRRRVLPRDTAVVFELDHDVVGGVGNAPFHAHSEGVAQLDTLRSVLGLPHRARAIDVVMPTGIGEQREDRLRRGADRALNGLDVTGPSHGRQRRTELTRPLRP